ncbi:hypothetical protein LOTGIDRAFT_237082 [Lottia gigantea]|uniref:RING-type domain-containing protein n=1 Tax=Lottia gigantea TaxID=225164 RepID=V3ZIV8_LOTGI|nr:hypothetical protein LOTGIDRAFT_237082 [Lottia gigantea]ESO82275.1 hypothetical protein LOTGIDRAFT_237082 [Lottia gigantea]
MPKSRKSSKKNGKQADKPENQWVHVEETPQPDSWEIVEDASLQEGEGPPKVEGQRGAEEPLKEAAPLDDSVSQEDVDDDLIVILEDSCQQSLDLSLVTGKIPQESPKQESPSSEESPITSHEESPITSHEESPITSHEESPESELDKSSDFQIIDHSEDESSNETDLLLENEILETAKRNVSLKYSHIVRQSSPPTAEPSVQSTSALTCTGTPVPPVGKSLVAEKSLSMERQSSKEAALTDKKQRSGQGAKPKTEIEGPRTIVPDKPVSPSQGKDVSVEVTETDETASSLEPTSQKTTQGAATDVWTGFVEKKSKKQKKKEKKRQATVEATADDSDQTANPDSKDSEDQQITQKSEQEASSVQKEYFETFSKNKKQRDLATMSILLAKDQTIDDLQDEEEDANTEDLCVEEAVANTEDLQNKGTFANTEDLKGKKSDAGTKGPKRSLEVVRESSVPEETESISGGSEETASVAGTEDSSDRPDGDGGKDIDDQIVPKKVSKSARRRKKLKEKMAKVIENFSNPVLVMEKYEKTFGEDYIPPSKVLDTAVDSSITCPVCLELYYHPYRVEPCGHVFCELCLRKLTTRSCLDIPCPLCRKIIQSCQLDEELSHHITKSFPVKSAARNRAERKSKTKKNPLPRMDMEPGKPVSIKDIHARGGILPLKVFIYKIRHVTVLESVI